MISRHLFVSSPTWILMAEVCTPSGGDDNIRTWEFVDYRSSCEIPFDDVLHDLFLPDPGRSISLAPERSDPCRETSLIIIPFRPAPPFKIQKQTDEGSWEHREGT
ncbi:hypothetical protein QBC32DRAFT_348557 [Pseudoneurospora amorphoporcata]|uniref:Uncharacterized protein n=1 Tax=Pseudoneurospora amorphoporcata TaxID=241081 RepID=A0AAN6SE68_9PEZI|nr:hypothetical protein QBC32DRAFT_348557 [Pseudoneurospora amorphoporcata]